MGRVCGGGILGYFMEPNGVNLVLTEWLKSDQRDINLFKFRVVNISEEKPPTPEIINMLSEEYIVANISTTTTFCITTTFCE
jgi:hypothetical protein